MTTRFTISPDSTRLAYDVTGDGPPLLLLDVLCYPFSCSIANKAITCSDVITCP